MFDQPASQKIKERNLQRAGTFDELNEIRRLNNKYATLVVFNTFLGFLLLFPIHILMFGGVPITEKLSYIVSYGALGIKALIPGSDVSTATWWNSTIGWYFSAIIEGITNPGSQSGINPIKSAVVLSVWGMMGGIPAIILTVKKEKLDPTPKIFGDTRWADEDDIEAMSSKDLIGFDGKLFLVGKLGKKFLHMKETLSVLLLAPPGTW